MTRSSIPQCATIYAAGSVAANSSFAERRLGLSAAVLAKLTEPTRAAANLINSDPVSPHESPITPERVAFLKTKPYKGTTINVMVLKATVGDGVKYHVPHWEEATGGKVNVAEVPIETLHTQIFSDLSSGLGKYDAYMTGCWFYGDFFVPKDPYIVSVEKFIGDPKTPYWEPDQWIPAMRKLYSWDEKSTAFCSTAMPRRFTIAKTLSAKRKTRTSSRRNTTTTSRFRRRQPRNITTSPTSSPDGTGTATVRTTRGISLHAKVNEQGFFHFLTLSAPFVVSPENKYYFFNPDTMKPLINSEGHVRALEDYVKFLANGPKEEIAWTLGQGCNLLSRRTFGDRTDLGRPADAGAGSEELQSAGQNWRSATARHDRGLQSDQRPMEEIRPQPGWQH